jgi:hypothetical protein
MLFGIDLVPSAAGVDVESTDVPAFQQIQWPIDLLGLIKLSRTLRPEVLKPRWEDEIRNVHVSNLVTETVVFTGIADFIGVESSGGGIARLHHNGQIDVGIGKHFEQFVAGGDRPIRSVFHVCTGKDFSDRQSVGSEIVITQGARVVGVIENGEPPGSCRWFGTGRHESEFGIDSPRRPGKSFVACCCKASITGRISASDNTVLALIIEICMGAICGILFLLDE